MDIAHILAEYGAYYLASGQNSARVKQLLLQAIETTTHMTPIKTDDTIYQMGNSSISSLVQSFQKGWTPKGGLKVIPNQIQLRQFKVDFDETPDTLEATWLGFLASDGVDRKDWPFVKWLIEVHIIPKIKEEMELQVYGKGVYAAPTAGTASAANTTMDGLKKIIQLGVDSNGTTQGVINHVAAIGPLTAATIFDQVEAFVDKISSVYQTKRMNVFLPYAMERAYLRDKRAKGFYTISTQSGINKDIDFTPQQVVGLPSLAGETFMFATPKENMFHITKKSANQTKFKLEEAKRQVSLMCDWWEGIGFGINEAVWTTLDETV
ncbi:MAG: hypothetical protein ACWA6U_07945 [Breznakibacter sp.]